MGTAKSPALARSVSLKPQLLDDRDGLAGASEATSIDGQGIDIAKAVVGRKLDGAEALRRCRRRAATTTARTEAHQQDADRRHPPSLLRGAHDMHCDHPLHLGRLQLELYSEGNVSIAAWLAQQPLVAPEKHLRGPLLLPPR
jgi:hypothetical protein